MASPAEGRRPRVALLPGALVGLLAAALALSRSGAAEGFELDLYDLRAATAAAGSPASGAVVLVTVDDVAVRLAGGSWPIPRGALAAVVEEARRAGARVVAVDFVLEDPLEASLADENAALQRALTGGGVVVAAAFPRADAPAPPPLAGPWAVLRGTFRSEEAAEEAALAASWRGAWPVAIPADGGVELWAAGFASEAEAGAAAPGGPVPARVRRLAPEELLRGDARTAAVRRRRAVDVGGASLPGRYALASPLPRFAMAAEALGGVSQEADQDGRIRALRHVYPTADGDFLSLPLAAAWLAAGRPALWIERGHLRLGERDLPLGPDGRLLVRWRGPWDGSGDPVSTYRQVSAALLLRTALAREGEGTTPSPESLAPLAGAVAIVSPTATASKDRHPTPVNPHATGGEIVAAAVDGLLRGEAVRRAPPAADAALSLLVALAAALLSALPAGVVSRPLAGLVFSGAGVAALLVGWWVATALFLARGLWLPAALPLAGGALSAFATQARLFARERADRRFVHDALGRYTSPALVRELVRRPELLDRFGGTRQELTVYFSDIRGFTSIAEGLPAERLVELLGEYLAAMTEAVERHGGYVDKYVGDAIMAVWGAPVPEPDHAGRACAAALEMRRALDQLRPGWKERFGVEIQAGAGLNTGPMVAGNVGSRRKANYTVLGDAVNLASRLEGANKAYGTSILVGEGTRAAAGEAFAFRSVDLVRVKGRSQGVAVFELVGRSADLSPEDRAFLAGWEAALSDYRAGR
ncbi:MAG TPA: CHASE2 domain-containing protein, partial [Anaeromyxobacteraceae bacterium]|nr:CHASE2 domain-containing protein [Anaeromyxobacteraceae bacterium]